MARVRHTSTSLGGLLVAVMLLGGCGNGGALDAGGGSRTPTVEASRATADVRACAGVEALIGHLSVETSRWSPQLKPFDQDIAERIGRRASDIAREVPLAETVRVKTAIRGTALSFRTFSVAMMAKDHARVDRALAASRSAYRELKKTCAFESGSVPTSR